MFPSSSPNFFDQLQVSHTIRTSINPAELQEELEKVALCIRENRYYQNGLALEKLGEVDGCHISSIRLSGEKRALLLTIKKSMVIMRYLPTHKYPPIESLIAPFSAFIAKYRENSESVCQNFPIQAMQKPVKDSPVSLRTLRFQQTTIFLDENQSQALEMRLPGKIHGYPGAGKSLIGVVALQEQHYGRILYYAKSPFLVDKQKALLEEQGLPVDRECEVHFLSAKDLYPSDLTHSALQVRKWVQQIVATKIPCLLSVDSAHLIQKLQTLYVLKKIFSSDFVDKYCAEFENRSLHSSEQISGIIELFLLFVEEFLNDEARPFIEGFVCRDHLPNEMFTKAVLDENQDYSVAENFFFFMKTENSQILFLRDMKQSQAWQGTDSLTLCESILHLSYKAENKSPFRMSSLTLNKSYRNSHAVTALANRMLTLLNRWIQGTIAKDEYPLFIEPSDETGQVRAYTGVNDPNYIAIAHHLPEHSTQWAVIARPEHIEEARKDYGPNVLILTTNDVPGLEFICVVRYKVTNREVLAEQDGDILKEFIKNPNQPLYRNRSTVLGNHIELLQSVGTDVVVNTRSRDLVLVIEPPVGLQDFEPSKRKVVSQALDYLYQPALQPAQHAAPWICNLSASSFEEWAGFVRQLWSQGVEQEAQRLFERYIQPNTPLSFLEWINPDFQATAVIAQASIREEFSESLVEVGQEAVAASPRDNRGQTVRLEKKLTVRSLSKKDVSNIRNFITLKDYNATSIVLDDISDLTYLLWGHAVVPQRDSKNPLVLAQQANAKGVLSVAMAFATSEAESKPYTVILSKIEKIFNLRGVKRYTASKQMFQSSCPDALQDFIKERGALYETPTMSTAIFWLMMEFPNVYKLFEIMLGVKSDTSSRMSTEGRQVLLFLLNDWKEKISPHITLNILKSPAYLKLTSLFSTHGALRLDLDTGPDNHPDAMLYNIVAAQKKTLSAYNIPSAFSELSDSEKVRVLQYRSEKSGLCAFQIAEQNKDISGLVMLVEALTPLHQNNLYRLTKDMLESFWEYIVTIDLSQNVSQEKMRAAVQSAHLAILAIELEAVPLHDIPVLRKVLKFFCDIQLSAERMDVVFSNWKSVLSRICRLDDNIAQRGKSDPTDRFYLLHLFLEKKRFAQALDLLENGLRPGEQNLIWIKTVTLSLSVKAPITIWRHILDGVSIEKVGVERSKVAIQAAFWHAIEKYVPKAGSLDPETVDYDIKVIEELLQRGLDIMDFTHIPKAAVSKLQPAELFLCDSDQFKAIHISEEHPEFAKVRVANILLHIDDLRMNTLGVKHLHAELQAKESRCADTMAHAKSMMSLQGSMYPDRVDFVKEKFAELNDMAANLMSGATAQIHGAFNISLSPQSQRKNQRTFLGIALALNRPELALALLCYGVDAVSHLDSVPYPLLFVLVKILREDAEQDPQYNTWRTVADKLISILSPFQMQYALATLAESESANYSRHPERKTHSLFVALLVKKEFCMAQALIEGNVVDLKWNILCFKSEIQMAAFLVLEKKKPEGFFEFQKSFIKALRKVHLGYFMDLPHPDVGGSVLSHILKNGDLDYLKCWLEAFPELAFSYHIATEQTKVFGGSALIEVLQSDLDKSLIERICLMLSSAMESLKINNELMTEALDVDASGEAGGKKTALYLALSAGLLTLSQRLLDMGASLSLPSDCSAFCIAMAHGASVSLLTSILRKSAEQQNMSTDDYLKCMRLDGSAGNQNSILLSRTYLQASIISGNIPAIRVCLEERSDLPIVEKTCLILAVDSMKPESVCLVLRKISTCLDPEAAQVFKDAVCPDLNVCALELALIKFKSTANPLLPAIILLLLKNGVAVTERATAMIGAIPNEELRARMQLAVKKGKEFSAILFSNVKAGSELEKPSRKSRWFSLF